MTHHADHPQHANHANHANHGQQQKDAERKALHKDWRTWAVVILMLIAMATYVLTMDESDVPGSQPQPAAASADAG
jgi:hypothetical protein